MAPRFLLIAFLVALTSRAQPAAGTPNLPLYEQAPIHYSRATPHDAVSRLVTRLATGGAKLAGSDLDILRAVLRELAIPVESQLAVFSGTSLQSSLIRADNPRALYFSDSVYVGWVPGGLIEAAAVDAELGPVFYSLDPQDARDGRRTFVRENSCLRCHGSIESPAFPRLFARSYVPDKSGEPLVHNDPDTVDDSTNFENRWGGWYVTGFTGRARHWGNAFASRTGGIPDFTPVDDRPTELSKYFDTSRYLTPTSDVLALIIFEHQLSMHNSLTRAAQQYRRAVAARDPAIAEVLANSAEDIVDHLLFHDASRVPAGVTSTDAFRRAFAADAPRSQHGYALKDLSLKNRLFANRCSFLIYSESFLALPAPLKVRVIDRLRAALDGDARYFYLEADEKQRIREVLTETHPDFRPSATNGSDRH